MPNDADSFFALPPRDSWGRLVLALAMPFVAFGVESAMWPIVHPSVYFLFYPAVFVAAWLGGRRGAVGATLISAPIIAYYFIEPRFAWHLTLGNTLTLAVFMSMGYLFGEVHERLERAKAAVDSELAETESKYQAIVEQSLVGIYVAQEGIVRYANPRIAEMLGFASAADMIDQLHVLDVIAPEDREGVLERMTRVASGELSEADLQLRCIRQDGSPVILELHARAFEREGRTAIIGAVLNVTDKVEALRHLRDREALLARTGEIAHIGGWDIDTRTMESSWTDEVSRIHGLPVGTKPSVEMGLTYYAEESRPVIQAAFAAAAECGIPYDLELPFAAEGGVRKWVRTTGEAVYEDGVVVRVEGILQDITARKLAEEALRNLNVTLERRVEQRTAEVTAANKELEAFAYAVSHDLRAPLRAMSGFAQALVEDCAGDLDDQGREYLAQITSASRNMGELIDALLSLSRATRVGMARQPVDITALASAIFKERGIVSPRADVETSIEPGLSVHGDPRMLESVMRNLIGNAWKYSERNAHAHIAVTSADIDGESWICVTDDGVGFDPAYAHQLFQPFHRLHRQDEFPGIGIGLATVARIIARHGGEIRAEGEVGRGARFCFRLPSAADLPEAAAEPPEGVADPPAPAR